MNFVLNSIDCPINSTYVHGTCFYISTEGKNATEAQNHCRQLGGRLFEPKSLEENDQLGKYLNSSGLVSITKDNFEILNIKILKDKFTFN